MDNAQIFTIVLVIAVGALLVYGLGYVSGRLFGYRQGLDKGKTLSTQVQHLKGMTDGYVMALQHTPAQRNEYMNNVLLRTGAMTPAEIEADRQRRFRIQMEA
jgi:hypothetical protein